MYVRDMPQKFSPSWSSTSAVCCSQSTVSALISYVSVSVYSIHRHTYMHEYTVYAIYICKACVRVHIA